MVDRLPEFQGPKYAGSYSWAPSIRVARNSDYGTTGLSVGQRVFGLADWPMLRAEVERLLTVGRASGAR